MTAISRIIKKYTPKTNTVDILCYSKSLEFIKANIDNTKINIVELHKSSPHHVYPIYIVDMEHISTVPAVYKKFLSDTIVIDYANTGPDWQNLKNLYDKYSSIYPTLLITMEMEHYLYSNNLHDFLIKPNSLNEFLTKKL